ncbi:ATP-binding protein [Acaryochloris sp. CCMEE 5410]|nr:ATP-binding protein [Acaryochloris sp. CCMEE 5410]
MQLAADPGWLERAENCLLLGPSGVGKTHLATGVSQKMLEFGKRVKFFAANALVQQLQQAKLQLQLHPVLKNWTAMIYWSWMTWAIAKSRKRKHPFCLN